MSVPIMKWHESPITEESNDVFRIPLPLPDGALKAVNSYVLKGSEQILLVDPGWDNARTHDLLVERLKYIGVDLAQISQTVVTHMHRDHIGMATALRDLYQIAFAIGENERKGLEWATRVNWDTPEPQIKQMKRFGAFDIADQLHKMGRDADIDLNSWQLADGWIEEKTKLETGSHSLEVFHTPGHTAGHIILRDSENGFTITGDHLLPSITPSIGFDAIPTDSPLTDFIYSLEKLLSLRDTRYFPAHGQVGESAHTRAEELKEHHHDRLREMVDALSTKISKTASSVALSIPWTKKQKHFRELDLFNQMLAVIETDAHLTRGHEQNLCVCTESSNGKEYRRIA